MPEPRRNPGGPVEQRPRPERMRTGWIRGQERLRRSVRLRSAMDFQRVRRRGRSLNGPLFALGYARQEAPPTAAVTGAPPAPPPAASRVGFSISKRVGKAVVRNVVKRRLRESIRRRLSRLASGWDIVITARPAAAGATYDELDAELLRSLERAKLLTTLFTKLRAPDTTPDTTPVAPRVADASDAAAPDDALR